MAIVCGEAGVMHGSPPGGEPSKQYPSAWFPLSSNVVLPPRGQEMLRLDFLILHPVMFGIYVCLALSSLGSKSFGLGHPKRVLLSPTVTMGSNLTGI